MGGEFSMINVFVCRKCGHKISGKNPNKKWYPCPVCQKKMIRKLEEDKVV